jgi:hypothetical protein
MAGAGLSPGVPSPSLAALSWAALPETAGGLICRLEKWWAIGLLPAVWLVWWLWWKLPKREVAKLRHSIRALVSSPAWVHELIEHLVHAEAARLLARRELAE